MKDIFSIGAIQHFERQVSINDIASFNDQAVHQVYATFALGRDAEWCCRLFVLEMIEDDEEGLNHNFDAIPDKKTKIYKTKYLGFFHDFKDGVSLDEIKEKYNRRIKRFYDVIKNKCIFIRDDVKFKESDIGTYNLLNAELKKHNSENVLVLIANTKLLSISGLDESIKVFIENNKVSEWQHHSIVPMIQSLI